MRIALLCNTIACNMHLSQLCHHVAASLTNTCVRFIGIVILRPASTNYVVMCSRCAFHLSWIKFLNHQGNFKPLLFRFSRNVHDIKTKRNGRQKPLKHLCAFHRNCYFAAHFNHSAVLWNVVKGCLVAVLLHADMQVLCSFAPHLLLSIHMCKHSEFHRFQS